MKDQRHPRYEWPNGARIAIVLQVPLELWSERDEDGLGFVPKLPADVAEQGHRDLLTESMQRYGPEVGMWRLIELLDRHGLPAMGVFSGVAVERYPEVAQAFVNGAPGREICAHSWGQDVRSYRLSREEMRANVRRCVEVIQKTTGERPYGWVSPGGQFLEETAEILAEEGFLYHGDYADTDSARVMEVAGRQLVAMSVPWEVNDYSQYAITYHPPSAFVEIFKRSFDVLYQEGGQVLGAVAHAAIYGRAFGVSAYEEVISYARGHRDVWFTNRRDIARWVLEQYGDDQRPEPGSACTSG